MKIKRIILVLVVFLLIGEAGAIPYSLLTKWGGESVYAKNNDDQGGKKVTVPEPSTLLLLGLGLLGLGLAVRRRKR